MIEKVSNLFKQWLEAIGITVETSIVIVDYTKFLFVLILSYLAFLLAKFIIVRIVHSIAAKTKSDWDDIMIKRKVFIRFSFLVPLLILNLVIPYVFAVDYELTVKLLRGLVQILMIITGVSIITSILKSFTDIYNTFKVSKSRPIKGYLQVVTIVIYILAGVAVISIFLGEGGFGWLAGFGAFSAILMLVFKDPILGFVGGIQLTSNNMLELGDWISMPKYGADGDVIDITLTTVKVQNWDKTITTIPTYTLVTDYFQNWRGMEESGGRRIKRAINIDMSSVKFCTDEMLDQFRNFHFLQSYIIEKDNEIEVYNKKYNINNDVLVNGRRHTNLGVFRAYLKEYLSHKPEVNMDMTFLVRQLQPTENGLPMEVYVFSKEQDWAIYEDIQSDIFDHILAVVPEFELRVHQNPSGADFKAFIK